MQANDLASPLSLDRSAASLRSSYFFDVYAGGTSLFNALLTTRRLGACDEFCGRSVITMQTGDARFGLRLAPGVA
jgi:hypothetical protein